MRAVIHAPMNRSMDACDIVQNFVQYSTVQVCIYDLRALLWSDVPPAFVPVPGWPARLMLICSYSALVSKTKKIKRSSTVRGCDSNFSVPPSTGSLCGVDWLLIADC